MMRMRQREFWKMEGKFISNDNKLIRTQTNAKNFLIPLNNLISNNQILLGPHRVFPGRLSVRDISYYRLVEHLEM